MPTHRITRCISGAGSMLSTISGWCSHALPAPGRYSSSLVQNYWLVGPELALAFLARLFTPIFAQVEVGVGSSLCTCVNPRGTINNQLNQYHWGPRFRHGKNVNIQRTSHAFAFRVASLQTPFWFRTATLGVCPHIKLR